MFKTKISPLILEDFSILDSSCETIFPVENETESSSKDKDLSVYIDFDILKDKEDQNKIVIFVEVELNKEKKTGYYAKAKGAAIFYIDDKKISKKDKDNLVLRSGVSICITNIRAYIANITSSYPLGKYQFPAIDMNDLLKQKMLNDKNENSTKE